MRLRTLLELPELRLELICGRAQLEREVSWAVATDLLDPGRYLTGGELVLTGLVWRRTPADSRRFADAAARVPVSGIAAGVAGSTELPGDLVSACQAYDLPLFRVPPDIAFHTVAEQVARRISAARSADLADVLGRHRRLVGAALDQVTGTPSAVASALGPVLDLVERDLGMRCWVLTPTGRVIADSHELPSRLACRIVRSYLTGERALTVAGERPFSLFGVSATRRSDPGGLAGWVVAVESDHRSWSAERRHLVDELVALITTEYAQLEHRLAADRPLADELLRLVAAQAAPAELLPHLLVCGLSADSSVAVVAASGPPHLRTVLEDLLAWSAPMAQVAELAGTTVAVIPTTHAEAFSELREELAALAPGLGTARLRVGVSRTVTASGLGGALDEAQHACHLAGMSGDPVSVVGHEQLASHLLLLAATPDEVRRQFRTRMLGPLLEYDQRHGTDLVPTLRSFLAHSGSWAACAADLHVHVNTLRYRISRIEEMTGRNLRHLEDQVDFFLALGT